MAIIKFINSKGMELEISKTIPFLLSKKEGLIKGADFNINSSKSLGQDGETPSTSSFNPKDLDFEFEIFSTDFDMLKANTEKVIEIFNPKLCPATLIYEEGSIRRFIKVMLDGIPSFGEGTGIYCRKVQISMTAYSPFWIEEEEKFQIGSLVKTFRFPIKILPIMKFGHIERSLIFNANNRGHINSGMKIEFLAARGTVTNPSIVNINTQKMMKINKMMELGEKIIVTTDYDNKNIVSILNGSETKALKYIDFRSKFLELDVGDNLFRYDADGNLDNLEVSVYYTPKFLGV